jgi:8-oxo-dGTP pyrophosphatase MutT (NUDIX family)
MGYDTPLASGTEPAHHWPMSFIERTKARLHALDTRVPHEFPTDAIPDSFRYASVLMPFWEERGSIKMACILRSSSAPTHASQVAFPGGRIDDTDENALAAALRETHEEVGIPPERVHVFGRLDDAWAMGKFHLIPHVGWVDGVPDIVHNPDEVEMAIVSDLEPLMEPEARIPREVTHNGRTFTSHYFELPGANLTGLSADLFYELLLWLRGEPSSRGAGRLAELQQWQAQGFLDVLGKK